MSSEAFWEGFESQKEAGLKEMALAGMLAATPAAKAGGNLGTAATKTMEALRKTDAGKKVKETPIGRRFERLFKRKPGASNKGVADVNLGKAKGGRFTLKDLNKLQYQKGKFTGTLSPTELKGKYQVNKNFDVGAKSRHGGETSFNINFKKDF